jgi:hypothetical protein
MAIYTPPLRDMQFVMHELLNVTADLKPCLRMPTWTPTPSMRCWKKVASLPPTCCCRSTSLAIPRGCKLDTVTHEVTTPTVYKEAYTQYVEGGWPALACDPEFGGQGLPLVVNQCFYEMMNSANQAWTMYPGLTHGAYAALHTPRHGRTKSHLSCTK